MRPDAGAAQMELLGTICSPNRGYSNLPGGPPSCTLVKPSNVVFIRQLISWGPALLSGSFTGGFIVVIL